MSGDTDIWKSEAEAELLAGRAEGFWNLDYFERVLLPLLSLPQGARVLDVGAGNGALSFVLARLRPDLHVTGVDLTQELVDTANAQAASQGLARVTFAQGDARQLAFADASFDAAVCQTLLIHLPDPAPAVREMARVVKPGGAFMAAEFHILNIDWPVDSASGSSVDFGETSRLTRLLLDGYRASGQGDLQVGGKVPFIAREAGLDVIDCRINDRVAHGFPPYRKASEQASLAEGRSWVGVFEDSGYRSWVEGAMTAAGGTTEDVDNFLGLLPARARAGFKAGDYSFVWLINPVLLVTVARKPASAG